MILGNSSIFKVIKPPRIKAWIIISALIYATSASAEEIEIYLECKPAEVENFKPIPQTVVYRITESSYQQWNSVESDWFESAI
ncbi:MAG: hypothetical protein ACKO96_29250, partial [Flammeovirgaceae bacterium]